jgi:hypothetical protein
MVTCMVRHVLSVLMLCLTGQHFQSGVHLGPSDEVKGRGKMDPDNHSKCMDSVQKLVQDTLSTCW